MPLIQSEPVKEPGAPEQVVKTCPIEAQSADIAPAMASICNDERARFGGLSGRAGFFHRLSALTSRPFACERRPAFPITRVAP
jgi:hypothetical protein